MSTSGASAQTGNGFGTLCRSQNPACGTCVHIGSGAFADCFEEFTKCLVSECRAVQSAQPSILAHRAPPPSVCVAEPLGVEFRAPPDRFHEQVESPTPMTNPMAQVADRCEPSTEERLVEETAPSNVHSSDRAVKDPHAVDRCVGATFGRA